MANFKSDKPKVKVNLFYPLYDEFDRKFFAKLKIGVQNGFRFIGDKEEKVFFLKSLLVLQMLKDYRAPLVAIKDKLSQQTDLDRCDVLFPASPAAPVHAGGGPKPNTSVMKCNL